MFRASPASSVVARPSFSRKGFSVLQLAISIAIAAVLASLLFGVAQKASQSAKAASCVSNLRQWSVLFSIYSANHNGNFPLAQPFGNGISWNSLRSPLTEPLLAAQADMTEWARGRGINGCPQHVDSPNPNDPSVSTRFYSYVYNIRLGNPAIGASYREKVTGITRPAEIVVIGDATEKGPGTVFYNNNYFSFLHRNRCNVLFVDGHVDSLSTVSDRNCNPAL